MTCRIEDYLNHREDMNQILFGDCRESMRQLHQQGVKVQTCVTSPPYFGLRDYGHSGQIGLEQSPEEFVTALVETFRHVRDIMADDGTLWLNLGDSYYNYRPGKGQALVKQSVSSTKQDLPDVCARRGNKLDGLKEKDLIGIPWRVAFALQADGWYLRQDIIWHKPNPMPESVRDRCTKAHEYIFLLSKSKNYYFDSKVMQEDAVTNLPIVNKTARSRHTLVATAAGREGKDGYGSIGAVAPGKRNRRSVWTVATRPYKGAHFATYPEQLIEPCILAGAPAGGIVFDPFMGSGTTAAVAIKNGRNYLGCELNPEYKALQDERIAKAIAEVAANDNNPQLDLLSEIA